MSTEITVTLPFIGTTLRGLFSGVSPAAWMLSLTCCLSLCMAAVFVKAVQNLPKAHQIARELSSSYLEKRNIKARQTQI